MQGEACCGNERIEKTEKTEHGANVESFLRITHTVRIHSNAAVHENKLQTRKEQSVFQQTKNNASSLRVQTMFLKYTRIQYGGNRRQ